MAGIMAQTELDTLMEQLEGLDEDEFESRLADAHGITAGLKWLPNPGPQTDAYLSQADMLLFGGQPGGGKQTALNTRLLMPSGWTTMGEIRVGDQVFDENGLPCNVIAKSEIDTTETAYKITFSDGSIIEAGERHQWVTSTRKERQRALKSTQEWRDKRKLSRPWKSPKDSPLAKRNSETAKAKNLPTASIRTTREIYETLLGEGGRLNHSVAVCKPLQYQRKELIIDPYVLGAWLGDGTVKSGDMTGIDEEIYENIAQHYTVTRVKGAKKGYIRKFAKDLRLLNLFSGKHIPDIYLRSSIEQRLSLLQGLMDTDGTCDTRGQCEFSQVRKHIAEQFLELINSLGIKSTMREGVAKLNGRITGPNFKIKFMTELPVFRLPRKVERQKIDGFRGTHDVRYIQNVEKIPNIPMQCIEVDSPNKMYLVGRSLIPTHNSQLILGLAFNCQRRTLVMRRKYSDLGRIIEDALKIHGTKDGFRGSPPPRLQINKDQIIDFGAAQYVGDEQSQMGKGRDFLGIDEATHFAEVQIRFLMGWNRTDDPNQRVRTVLATNPPLSSEGLWVIQMFAPWLDPAFHSPAKPGELRWVVSDAEGKDKWVDGPGEILIRGKMVRPKSRTYIPSQVSDNPYYAKTDYERELDNMPEPYRSLLMGGFQTSLKDAPLQLIPTSWIKEAMLRWQPDPPDKIPMCCIAADVARGGDAETTLARRYGWWFDKMIAIPGKQTPTGGEVAGVIVKNRRDNCTVVIDMGGGYGGSSYDTLIQNGIDVVGYLGAKESTAKTKEGILGFYNKRAEIYWKFKEALDPGQPGGSPVMLPDDPILLADLCAPQLDMNFKGVKIESKDKLIKNLGRSPDRGDAVVMAWAYGANWNSHAKLWIEKRKKKQEYQIIRKRRY
jgi:hypothetical protein